MLKKALRRLEPYPEIFESVVVTPFRAELGEWLRMLEAHGSPIHPPFPLIRLIPSNERR